ncbi:MAG: peptidoglycan D,D-transpeptidase FtsI family protein [Actinomycetota bacterium]
MNQRIRRLTVVLLALYAVLFVQLNVIQVGRKTSLDADSRNTRQTVRDFNDPRGDIRTSDGQVIATSVRTEGDDQFDWQRVYPFGDLYSHITGYFTFGYGATQVERVRNDVLAGRTVEQQIKGIGALFSGGDTSGSVEVTIDSRIQEAARSALGEREGSVVVVDPSTGAVKALWSWPSYDTNIVAVHNADLVGDTFTFLDTIPSKPLLANAYQERYMPGSTFKILTTAAALDAGLVTRESVWAEESEFVPPQTTDPIQNYDGKVCGGNLMEVFRRSCNTPFARMAIDLGPETMVEAARRFGIGEPLPFDLPRAATSRFGDVDYFTQNLPLLGIGGFGQGNTQMVPLHMAMITAAIANGGVMMRPFAIAATYDHDGRLLQRTVPSVWRIPMSVGASSLLTELMIEVVNNGTASCCFNLSGVQGAAKTGTAQLNAAGEPERSHAWIVAFAPAEAPRYAVVVMLKGTDAEISAGTGGTLAGPIAAKVLNVALGL